MRNEPSETEYVDVDPDVHRATEADEEDVLRELYGEPDKQGFYTAEGD
jgi:hypothetical protein